MIALEHLERFTTEMIAQHAENHEHPSATVRESAQAHIYFYALVGRCRAGTATDQDKGFLATIARADRYFQVLEPYRELIG